MEYSYQCGDRVEKKIICGRLAGCWFPAKVIKINVERGTVNVFVLNHVGYKVTKFHMDVPLCYVRRSKYKFKVGDQVYSKILRGRKQGLWIPANIICMNHDGTFDLLVAQWRTYLVTKYSVQVPEKYLIPGNSSIMRRRSVSSSNMSFSYSNSYLESQSSESKNSTTDTCNSCKFRAWERELSKETKSSSMRRSLTIDKSYINNLQLFQSCGHHSSESRSLTPLRAITGEPGFSAMGKQSQSITRASSVSKEPEHFSFGLKPKPGFQTRCSGNLCQHRTPGCHSMVKPPFNNKNYPSDLENLSRDSYEDFEQVVHDGQDEPLIKLGHQQKQETEDERSWTILPFVSKRITDWGEQFEWSKSESPKESPSCGSPSVTATDWDLLSPRKSGSPTDLSNVSKFLFYKRESGRGSISSRHSIGGKSTILSSPHSKYDFMASCLSEDKETSFRKDWISAIMVKGQNIKHKMIERDTPLEELASWLSEGSNVKCGSEKRKPKMVKMMSFRKSMIPIQSKNRSGKKEGYKLSDLLENHVDSSKQGLAFFVGPVNGKLSYKISVFEKDNAKNIGRPRRNTNSIVISSKV